MRVRLLGFLTGFLAVAAVCVLWSRPGHRQVMLSEFDGSLKTVEIQFTKDSAPTLWPCLRSFFRAADPSMEVIVVCGTEEDRRAFWGAYKGMPQRNVRVLVLEAPITGWSRDRFLVFGSSPATLLCPRSDPSAIPNRTNDDLAAWAIAKQFPNRFRAERSDLVFDAGDVLPANDGVFLDDELPAKNAGLRDWMSRVTAMTQRPTTYLPGGPAHHIGMFAAPISTGVVIVADPDLGRALWTEEATRKLGAPDWSEAAIAPFRKAIEGLEKAGYRVVRAPVAVLGPKVYVTYTNGVFEERGGKKIAYLPTYGISELDDAGVSAFEMEGWEVRKVDASGVFRLCGTIGCLVNVLERG